MTLYSSPATATWHAPTGAEQSLPGKTEAGQAFVKEAFEALEARRGDLEASRRALGEN